GISRELQEFYYFNVEIKTKVQYFQITLDHLGYTIAIGRYLFPLFLILLALHYSMIPWLQRSHWVRRFVFVMPILSLILYYPGLFSLFSKNNEGLKQVIISGSNLWIVLYLITATFLLIFEAYSIEMKFFQRKFI